MMVKSVIILMAEMKLILAGCDLFAAHGTRKNKTWLCFNIMAASITGPSGKSFLVRSYLCGTILGIHNSWGYLWR